MGRQNGGRRLRSGEQRFYEGMLGLRFPPVLTESPPFSIGLTMTTGKIHIDVHVSNARFGPFFGYTDSFDVEWLQTAATPPDILPIAARKTRVGRFLYESRSVSIRSARAKARSVIPPAWWDVLRIVTLFHEIAMSG